MTDDMARFEWLIAAIHPGRDPYDPDVAVDALLDAIRELAASHARLQAELELEQSRNAQYMSALECLFKDTEGDLDFIKWRIENQILSIEARNAIDARASTQAEKGEEK